MNIFCNTSLQWLLQSTSSQCRSVFINVYRFLLYMQSENKVEVTTVQHLYKIIHISICLGKKSLKRWWWLTCLGLFQVNFAFFSVYFHISFNEYLLILQSKCNNLFHFGSGKASLIRQKSFYSVCFCLQTKCTQNNLFQFDKLSYCFIDIQV